MAPASHSRQRGTDASFKFSCSDKKETCRDRLPLILSAQRRALNGWRLYLKTSNVLFNAPQQTHLCACGCTQLTASRLRRSTPERVQVQVASCTADLVQTITPKTPEDTPGVTGMWAKPPVAVLERFTPPVFRGTFLFVCSTFAPAVGRCGCESGLWAGPTHRNVAFFGFLSADPAEWPDLTEGTGDDREAVCSHHSVCLCLWKHKESSQGVEMLNKMTDFCLSLKLDARS